MRMMCFGNSLSDRGSLYNVVDIVSFGLYNPPEKLDNYAKVKKAVPLQAKSSRLSEVIMCIYSRKAVILLQNRNKINDIPAIL